MKFVVLRTYAGGGHPTILWVGDNILQAVLTAERLLGGRLRQAAPTGADTRVGWQWMPGTENNETVEVHRWLAQ